MNTRQIRKAVGWILSAWLLLAVVLVQSGPAAPVARAASFVVANLDDSGVGSLRQAILDANASPGADTITFSVTGEITLVSTLPAVSDVDGLMIDGAGQDITISGNNTVRVMTVNSGAVLTLKDVTITGGLAFSSGSNPGSAYEGGGIYNQGTLTVSNSTFSGNGALMAGGGIYNDAGTLMVTDSTFSNNRATTGGGGVYNDAGTLMVTGSTFSGNSALFEFPGNGGGIFNQSGSTLTVTGSSFSGNGAYLGGGIINRGTLTVTGSTFSGNSAYLGGGIYNTGPLTVSTSTFSSNYTLVETLSYFFFPGAGGGIYNNNGPVTVAGSTFSANDSLSVGGGIVNLAGTLTVSNSTFSGNSADEGGGGIYGYSVGTLEVINSTFSGNGAVEGGGIDVLGTLTLKNTIVAHSPSGGNCSGSIIDGGGNLSYPDSSCPGISLDPLLGPLQVNAPGGSATHALLPGSPAIDAAVLANCPATDQRGVTRPQGAGCDIGAYELEVSGYGFGGFLAPVDNPPVVNQVKAGQTVPVKFSLAGDFGLDIFAAGYPKFQLTLCEPGDPVGPVQETVTPGNSRLSYDPDTSQYTYVWKTDKGWAGKCGKLILRFSDGIEYSADFKFAR